MISQVGYSPPELWGGLECTVNRVHDDYFDQVERSGHGARPDDLDRFAALGIRTIRYPVLWERTAPKGILRANWRWADQRLARLRSLGITPIVGLVHHGSGPPTTSLLDSGFPEQLATYAGAVARRYPWVEQYTPVNEPLTTARFSALYGYWYPHLRNPLAAARALLHQLRGVVLAMDRIREVNPAARLVQTEDLSRVFSTPPLAYQAQFENERRWLTFDLLCGRMSREHPMWSYLRSLGIQAGELAWFADHPSPPDVIGVNYYLTSERFLDHELEWYPPEHHGGNGRHRYADVEAVRVRSEGMAGPRSILEEVWRRYHIPVAVTEAHNGCTREEQMRWFLEVWEAAADLRREGAEVTAVTVWSLLGAYDWNSLVRVAAGHYEPGVFDLRAPEPRPTALVPMLRALSDGRPPLHPVLDSPGWWRRSQRFAYGARPLRPSTPPRSVRRLLLTGASGTLGQELARRADVRGLAHVLTNRRDMDIADSRSVADMLDVVRPWAVVNAAGYVRVDAAEQDRDRCFRENAEGAAVLAEACGARGIRLVTFSSDLVFDGTRRTPYDESAAPAPVNVYGASKLEAEQRVLAAAPDALVVRTSAFFGPHDEYNFVTRGLRMLGEGCEWRAAGDLTISPTYVPDLADAVLDLLIDGESGLWHLSNGGAVTWAELARRAAVAVGLDPGGVTELPSAAFGWPAVRPAYTVLGSRRGWIMPDLDQALRRYVLEAADAWRAPVGESASVAEEATLP